MRKSLPVMNSPSGPMSSAPTAPTSSGVPARCSCLRLDRSVREDGNHHVGLLPVEDGFSAPLGGGLRVRGPVGVGDRKSTRLNSSHANISYAVFCLKKK